MHLEKSPRDFSFFRYTKQELTHPLLLSLPLRPLLPKKNIPLTPPVLSHINLGSAAAVSGNPHPLHLFPAFFMCHLQRQNSVQLSRCSEVTTILRKGKTIGNMVDFYRRNLHFFSFCFVPPFFCHLGTRRLLTDGGRRKITGKEKMLRQAENEAWESHMRVKTKI